MGFTNRGVLAPPVNLSIGGQNQATPTLGVLLAAAPAGYVYLLHSWACWTLGGATAGDAIYMELENTGVICELLTTSTPSNMLNNLATIGPVNLAGTAGMIPNTVARYTIVPLEYLF